MPYAEGSTIFFKFFQDVVHLEDAQHLKALWSQAPVAHTCNPSYSGGRDQEDHILKSAQANSVRDPILKTLNSKTDWQSGSSGRELA
jgi:hypothetical protein